MRVFIDYLYAVCLTLLVILTLLLIANEQWLGVGIEATVCCSVILLALQSA